MNEDLTKATHSMMLAVGSLQDALKRNAVESLVLLDTIEAAVTQLQRIEALAAAIESLDRPCVHELAKRHSENLTTDY